MGLRHLVNMLSQTELKTLKQAFYAIDYDHTGCINIEALEKAFKIAGIDISTDEVKKIIETADGKLDYS